MQVICIYIVVVLQLNVVNETLLGMIIFFKNIFFAFRYTVHYTLPYVFSLCEEIVCDTNVTSCCLHVFGVYTLGNLLFSQPDLSNLNIGKTIRVNSKGIAGF